MLSSAGARVGSFDTDAFGVLLRMKNKVCQTLNNSFMLSSQPQAGVSKHPTRMLMPVCKSLPQGRGGPPKRPSLRRGTAGYCQIIVFAWPPPSSPPSTCRKAIVTVPTWKPHLVTSAVLSRIPSSCRNIQSSKVTR